MRYQRINEEADRLFAEAEARGEARGEAIGVAQALRDVLLARGFTIDADTEAHIAACAQPERLRAWITRAVAAPSLAAVFDD
jgi:Leu/Phe-tRNA-protein transferase